MRNRERKNRLLTAVRGQCLKIGKTFPNYLSFAIPLIASIVAHLARYVATLQTQNIYQINGRRPATAISSCELFDLSKMMRIFIRLITPPCTSFSPPL